MIMEEKNVNIDEVLNDVQTEADGVPAESLPILEERPSQQDPLPGPSPAIPPPKSLDNDNGCIQHFCDEAEYLSAHHHISYYWDFGKGFKSFIKRIVRFFLKCLVLPMRDLQNDYNRHVANSMNTARDITRYHHSQLQRHQDALNADREEISIHGAWIAYMSQSIEQLHSDINRLSRENDELSMSFSRVIHRYMTGDRTEAPVSHSSSEQPEAFIGSSASTSENNYEVLDYFKFQNEFRGTQSQIMERQKIYLPYFRNRKGRIFDFGCGRGEFLRLLKQENISSFGVDSYQEYEINGQMYGIDVIAGDGFTVLENVDETLGGIFCAQVIEHLSFQNIDKLCHIAYDKLEVGAYLILETPNPMCLSTMTNAFYVDPTHNKPIHPLFMKYLLESIGFSEVEFLWPDHSLEQLPNIKSDSIDNIDEVNNAINRVSSLLYGSQDYAVIAKK